MANSLSVRLGSLRLVAVLALLGVAAMMPPASVRAAGRVDVAALQVALRARGLYYGTVDGYPGPGTRAAVRALQRRVGLRVDGRAGPRTRRALGRLGRPPLGSRSLRVGAVGWDVSALQFRLAWRGFPSGPFDGGYGRRTALAIARYQRWSGLVGDGVAGRATQRALRRPIPRCPIVLARPLRTGAGDGFGPRGNRFHAGLDFPARTGTVVRAAARGVVVLAGWDSGGFGNLVVIAHPRGVTTWYGHLSRIWVRRGWRVVAGSAVGAVGATGAATGPHLHFEVRVRGAAVNPRSGLR